WPPRQPGLASPSTRRASAQTLIGAVIGATTWLPPRMLRAPEVRLPPAETPPFTTAPPRQPAKTSPRTPMALPQTLIGAVTGATTWLPPRVLRAPEARLPPAETPGLCLTVVMITWLPLPGAYRRSVSCPLEAGT